MRPGGSDPAAVSGEMILANDKLVMINTHAQRAQKGLTCVMEKVYQRPRR